MRNRLGAGIAETLAQAGQWDAAHEAFAYAHVISGQVDPAETKNVQINDAAPNGTTCLQVTGGRRGT